MRAFFKGSKTLIKYLATKGGKHAWPAFSPRLQILAYHRILPDNDPRYINEQPGMCVTPEVFEKNIIWLREYFKIIRLNEWLGSNSCKLKPNNYCAITFDDGWLDNKEFALPILIKHQVPITLFCVPRFIDNGIVPWPEKMKALFMHWHANNEMKDVIDSCPKWIEGALGESSGTLLQSAARDNVDRVIESLKVYSDVDINDFIDEEIKRRSIQLNFQPSFLTSTDIAEMVSTGLVDIGSHTLSHSRLSKVESAEMLSREIIESKGRLANLLNVSVETFCYPNGDVTPEAMNLVKQNYLGGCSLKRGWNYPNEEFATLKRINVHQDIAATRVEFYSRLSGLI